jgi:hypothetical protein
MVSDFRVAISYQLSAISLRIVVCWRRVFLEDEGAVDTVQTQADG